MSEPAAQGPPRGSVTIRNCAIANCGGGVHLAGLESVTIDGLDVSNTPDAVVLRHVGAASVGKVTVDNRGLVTLDAERAAPDAEQSRRRRPYRPRRPARRN